LGVVRSGGVGVLGKVFEIDRENPKDLIEDGPHFKISATPI
jgi:hypothetical protein